MERKKASDFPQELLKLFDLYVHGDIDRREFLEGAKRFAVGGVTAIGLWESLRANYAFAEQVPKSDPRIITSTATVPSPNGNGEIKGHLAKPAQGSKFPAVLVIHENRGLNPYIEDVARRLATAGYFSAMALPTPASAAPSLKAARLNGGGIRPGMGNQRHNPPRILDAAASIPGRCL